MKNSKNSLSQVLSKRPPSVTHSSSLAIRTDLAQIFTNKYILSFLFFFFFVIQTDFKDKARVFFLSDI